MASPREALLPLAAVVLTGGSSGIGKSFIELVRRMRPDLPICNLSRRSPPGFNSGNTEKISNHFPCDLSRPAEVARGAESVIAWLGESVPEGPVLLINNSGIGSFGAFPEADPGAELGIVDVNVRAVVDLTARLLPALRVRGGAIMNVSSMLGYLPTPGCATYGASKAFVLHWTLALAEELRGSGVRALAVCPGTTRTEFFQRAGVAGAGEVPWAMSSEAVAWAALQAWAEGRSVAVPGWKNRLLAGFGGRLPKAWAARLCGRVLARTRGRPVGNPKGGRP